MSKALGEGLTPHDRQHASGKALLGWPLPGWGIFNLVEGAIDHQILGIHHVRNESLARISAFSRPESCCPAAARFFLAWTPGAPNSPDDERMRLAGS